MHYLPSTVPAGNWGLMVSPKRQLPPGPALPQQAAGLDPSFLGLAHLQKDLRSSEQGVETLGWSSQGGFLEEKASDVVLRAEAG